MEWVPAVLRSDDLQAVKRLGRPQVEYRKLTFRKEERDRPEHEDAVLCSPGHPLFASLAEVLERSLTEDAIPQGVAPFIDPATESRYWIHFLTHEIVGESLTGQPEAAYAELIAVVEEAGGSFELAAPDVLHDLTPAEHRPEPPDPESIRRVTNWVRAGIQATATKAERESRLGQAELRSRYLAEAMDTQRRSLERRWAEYDERVHKGEDQYRLLRDDMVRRIEELQRRRKAKLDAFGRLGVVRPGPVRYLGSASVGPPLRPDDPELRPLRPDPEVERTAMAYAMQYEREAGREPTDVSAARDGSGFDIRSVRYGADPTDVEVRRIEVKGRSAATGDVGLYRTEWLAAQRFGDGFWLYVVYKTGSEEERLVTIQDPANVLRGVKEIAQVTGYRVPAASIEEAAE